MGVGKTGAFQNTITKHQILDFQYQLNREYLPSPTRPWEKKSNHEGTTRQRLEAQKT
ncbi:704_t:CDS:2 [Ambispora gerdemannii]|uniref:704_t:CDS:1 n=1 Tax=Ambispora gerdemannii TaxID=144530 RepID=A0A9N9FRX5_9GLOM|nr:704_t:CDS:2 [Ambispora gerdemannii]